jgi:hypothetical protein
MALDTAPSYATEAHGIHMIENFTVTIPVTADIPVGYSIGYNSTQGLAKIGNLSLSPTDAGQVMFNNITASITPDVHGNVPVIGFPTIQIVTRSSSNQAAPGTPPQGVLVPATTYGGISIRTSINLYAPAGYTHSATTVVTVQGTALLVGSSSSS